MQAAATLMVDMKANTSSLTKSLNDVDSKLKTVGSGASKIGKGLTASLSAPILGFGALALKAGSDFEQGMANVGAISKASSTDLKAMTSAAEELGRSTSFSATEAAEGMSFLAMAGFDTQEIIAAMPGVLNAAAASATDLATTADITSNVLSGFGLEAGEATRVADVLVSTLTQSNTDMNQLGQAMKYVAPVAASLGLSIEDTAAAIGTMSDAGIQASQAGTSLRGILSRLAAPSGEAAATIEELGVNVFDAQGNIKSMSGIISEFETGLQGMTAQQKQAALTTIVGQEAVSGFLALMDRGSEDIQAFSSSIENDLGVSSEVAAKQLDTMQGQIKLFKSALEGVFISVSNATLPMLTEMIKGLTPWVAKAAEGFANLSPRMQKIIVIGSGIVAAIGPVLIAFGSMASGVSAIAAVIGPLLPSVGALGTALSALTGPVGLVAAGLATLSVWAYNNNILGFKDAVNSAVESVKSFVSNLGDLPQITWSDVLSFAGETKTKIVDFLDFTVDTLSQITLSDIFTFASDTVTNLLDFFTFDFSTLTLPTVDDIFPFLAEFNLSDYLDFSSITLPEWLTNLTEGITLPDFSTLTAPEWLTNLLSWSFPNFELTTPGWVQTILDFQLPPFCSIEIPEWVSTITNFQIPEFNLNAPDWITNLLDFSWPDLSTITAPEWLTNIANFEMPDFSSLNAPEWLTTLLNWTWPALAVLTAPVWLPGLVAFKWPEIKDMIAPYWFDFLENFSWPAISDLTAPTWLTNLFDFSFPDISEWTAPAWITKLTSFTWPDFNIQKPQWLDDLLNFDVSRLNPFGNKNKQTNEEIEFSIPAPDTATFQSLLTELKSFIWPTPDLTGMQSVIDGLNALDWNIPSTTDLRTLNSTIDKVAALTWPEFPAQPLWVQTLMDWVWPDFIEQPEWLATLVVWEWPSPPSEPGWIDDLVNWDWPDPPSEPTWIADLMAWTWPTPPAALSTTPAPESGTGSTGSTGTGGTVSASSFDTSSVGTVRGSSTVVEGGINVTVQAQSIDYNNVDDLALLIAERIRYEMAAV